MPHLYYTPRDVLYAGVPIMSDEEEENMLGIDEMLALCDSDEDGEFHRPVETLR